MLVTGPVRVSRFTGNQYIVRTAWSDTLDLRQRLDLTNSMTYSGQAADSAIKFYANTLIPVATLDANVNAAAASLDPQPEVGDDFCPPIVQAGYVGAGHGLNIAVNVVATHGKTAVDVGSEWTNASGHKWYIIRIIDATHLLMLSENTGTADAWTFRAWTATATLTHSAGATDTTAITVTSAAASYLWPSYKLLSKECLLDGRSAVQNNGHYACTSVDFVERYEIYDPTAVLAYMIANRGSNPAPAWANGTIAAQATISNTYHYTANGACTVFHRITLAKPSYFADGVVQAGKLATPTSGSVMVYVPGAKAFSIGANPYDFQTGQTLASVLDIMNLTTARWASAAYPPSRFTNVRVAQDGTRDYGFALGYAPIGLGTAAVRKDLTTIAYTISTMDTKKGYPRFVSDGSTTYPNPIPAGTEFEMIAYRVPFVPPANATYAYWYQVGTDIYTNVEFHSTFAGDVVIDSGFAGMPVTLVESQGTIALAAERVTAAGAVTLSATGYGSAVLKIATDGPTAAVAAAAAVRSNRLGIGL